jgi:hydrogenase maturation protein HypF
VRPAVHGRDGRALRPGPDLDGALPLCAECRAEYGDPDDRRYHAQSTACPACGPRLRLVDGSGVELPAPDPLAKAARRIRAGGIVAVKGLGGYHLACDAENDGAVLELRRRKARDEKPFAVLMADLATARLHCDVSPEEAALLESPARPIVLLRRREARTLAPAVAPGNPLVGVMLPYTPLHHLLAAPRRDGRSC